MPRCVPTLCRATVGAANHPVERCVLLNLMLLHHVRRQFTHSKSSQEQRREEGHQRKKNKFSCCFAWLDACPCLRLLLLLGSSSSTAVF